MKKRVSCSFKVNSEVRYLLIRFTGSVIYPNDIDICTLKSIDKIKETSKMVGSKIWLIIDFSFLDTGNFDFVKEIDKRIKSMLSENVEGWVAVSRDVKQRIKLSFLSTFFGRNVSLFSSFVAAENAVVHTQAKQMFTGK